MYFDCYDVLIQLYLIISRATANVIGNKRKFVDTLTMGILIQHKTWFKSISVLSYETSIATYFSKDWYKYLDFMTHLYFKCLNFLSLFRLPFRYFVCNFSCFYLIELIQILFLLGYYAVLVYDLSTHIINMKDFSSVCFFFRLLPVFVTLSSN